MGSLVPLWYLNLRDRSREAGRIGMTGSPGALDLELANVGRRSRVVFSGTAPPFGLVHAEAVDGDGRFLRWHEYEEEGRVTISDDGIVSCAIGKLTELEPGETTTRRYEVVHPSTSTHPGHTASPGPGRNAVTDDTGYSHDQGAPGSTLPGVVKIGLA